MASGPGEDAIDRVRQRRAFKIHLNYLRMYGLSQVDQTGRGIDDSGRTDHQKKITREGCTFGSGPDISRQALTEPYDTWPLKGSTFAVRRKRERNAPVQAHVIASRAAQVPDAAVNFEN